MASPRTLQLLADAVLILHVTLVAFVIGGLVLILVGNWWRWPWVNGLWFRLVHLATIAVVAAEAWLGIACPLTTLEMWLRAQTRAPTYGGSFVAHWLQTLLYWDAAPWVFTAVYTLFALAVAAVWWCYPPESRRSRGHDR